MKYNHEKAREILEYSFNQEEQSMLKKQLSSTLIKASGLLYSTASKLGESFSKLYFDDKNTLKQQVIVISELLHQVFEENETIKSTYSNCTQDALFDTALRGMLYGLTGEQGMKIAEEIGSEMYE